MGDTTATEIRRALHRVAERLRDRAMNESLTLIRLPLLVVADELEREATSKKPRVFDKTPRKVSGKRSTP